MNLPNPNQNTPFERVDKDKYGQDEYGYRKVDGIEEIVHIPTGKSNMSYHKPEVVTHFENCEHVFDWVNKGLREIECMHCHYPMTFLVSDFIEVDGKPYVLINKRSFPILQ